MDIYEWRHYTKLAFTAASILYSLTLQASAYVDYRLSPLGGNPESKEKCEFFVSVNSVCVCVDHVGYWTPSQENKWSGLWANHEII